MGTNNKNIAKSWPVLAVFLLLILAITWAFTDKGINNTQKPHINAYSAAGHDAITHRPVSLETIVKYARSWGPIFTQWYGKPAPDLTFVDLDGKTHKLSEYAGKDVLVLFWATWCPPCRAEIPDLIELRKQKSNEELAIIAISDENSDKLKRFAAANKLTYTVASLTVAPAKPFSDTRALPTSFYIDKQQNFKLATEGTMSMAEIVAILESDK